MTSTRYLRLATVSLVVGGTRAERVRVERRQQLPGTAPEGEQADRPDHLLALLHRSRGRGDPGGGQGLRGGQPGRHGDRQGRPGRRRRCARRSRRGRAPTSACPTRPTSSATSARPAPGATWGRGIERDKVDIDQLLPIVRSYTEYNGTRCSMPMLADTYGLYYNKKMLAAAGYDAPPKTLSELEDDGAEAHQEAAGRQHRGGRLRAVDRLLRELARRTWLPASTRPGSRPTGSRTWPGTRTGRR